MTGVVKRRGIPLALYSDRHIVFRHPRPKGEAQKSPVADNRKPTQFARSPEAKGRVERANGTFQDRLVTELRLAGVSTLVEANSILESFLPRFNQRFGVLAAQPEVAYRQVDPELDIDTVLCIKERRRVARDNTVQYPGHTLQLFP